MNFFVTVGTTKFDSMIKAVDSVAKCCSYRYIFQIADGHYQPKNGECFSYTKDIDIFYSKADVVITHAGAGSIYRLLEKNKKIIIVPNIERVDKHQQDIAAFMAAGGYAKVCSNFDDMASIIESINDFIPEYFQKESFFKGKEIADFIGL